MYYVFTRRRANANPHVLWNRRRLARCVQPLGAGPAQDPVQGDRPQQPDGGLDRRRGAVLARDAAQGFQRRDQRGHHAARPDGNRRQDDAAAAAPRGDGLRRHGHLQDGGRRPALRRLRPGGHYPRCGQGARRLRGLPRGDRPPDAEELERKTARLRRQPAAGVLVPQRARRPRRPQGQEDPCLQQHHARLPLRHRRDRGQHGVRRSGAGAQQRRRRLRRHRQPLGQHRGLARGDEIALPDVARLEHQRDGGEPQHLEPARQARAELPARAGEDLREQDVGDAQESHRRGRQLQHREAALHDGQARQHHHRAGETGRSRDAQEAGRERGARRLGEALRRRVRGRVEQHGRQNARPESSNPVTAGTDELIAVARRVTRFGLWLGGALVLAAALLIGVDVTLRKFFNASIGGADELAGYALALGTAWSLGAALLDRAHIRIDSLYVLLARPLRLALDFAGLALFIAFFGLIARHGWSVVQQSWGSGSRSQSAIATPTVIPQSVWLAGLAFFFVIGLALLVHAVMLIARGNAAAAAQAISTRSAVEEVEEEIRDLKGG